MKQRILVGNDKVLDGVIVQQEKEYKILLDRPRLGFFYRAIKQKHIKIILIVSLLLLFVVLPYVYMYSHKLITMEGNNNNSYDKHFNNDILPIDNAADKDYYITRPNGRDDGGVVRVMFLIVSTRIDWTLCYAVASAYFTNISVIVTGYKKQNYKNVYKPEMYLHAAEQAGLQESDVVIALDSDIMFTGLDYLPFVDKFIKLSPADLNELDAKAVRTGKMMAPSIYGTEKNCFSPQTLPPESAKCHTAYEQVYQKHNEYVKNLTEFAEKPFVNYNDNALQHLNSGTSIHRVWAMLKVFAAYNRFMSTNKPININNNWMSDQSVFAKLYLELRLWEIEQDYFRKSTDELRTMHNEYGLYAGMMGLDLKGELSVMVHPTFASDVYEITTEHWQTSKSEEIESINVFDKNKDEFVRNLYNKTDVKKLFTERKLTRSYSNVHSVTISPPLLSIIPRHINGKDKPAERVYPALIHFASAYKEPRYNNALNYMQWSLPMMFDREEWKRGKQYAMSIPIELWTSNGEKLRLRYGDVCEKHPFQESHQYSKREK